MKALTYTEESTLICLKAISGYREVGELILWTDDLAERAKARYDNRPQSRYSDDDPRWRDEIKKVNSRLSWARGIVFGRLLQSKPDLAKQLIGRITNF